MMKILIIFISFSVFAGESNFEALFTPAKLSKLDWTSDREISAYIKELGKPDLKKENKYYYEVNKLKYPISFHTNGKKVKKVYFRTLDNSPSFEQAANYLKDNNFKLEQTEDSNYKLFVSDKKKMRLKFSAITKKLYSVEKWF